MLTRPKLIDPFQIALGIPTSCRNVALHIMARSPPRKALAAGCKVVFTAAQ
jgi:hypothetical protein